MSQTAHTALVTAAIAVLAVLAVVFAVPKFTHFRSDGENGARVWFYDQGAKKLYAAPRDLIPPDGKNDNRVRAIVIGFQGLGNDSSQLKIAYLEKYSPDLKALLERAEVAHAARRPFTEAVPPPGSPYYQANTQVKRPADPAWTPVSADEARLIMDEWRAWRGPAGQPPIISVPSFQ